MDDSAHRENISALVADDDEMNAKLMVRILESGGYGKVISTTRSTEIIDLCVSEKPDLLLLDVSMPSPNGFEILEQMKDLDGDTPAVVILTGHEHPSIERRALELGAVAMVGKTSSRDIILTKLDETLQALD